ncbi:jg27401, partial [Pararge aegeria aegeria]
GENVDTLRRRRTRELADRIAVMKKRGRDAERWHALKRSLYKPLTITFGFILAGIVIYTYVKH